MNPQLLKRKEFKPDEDKKLWKSYVKFPGIHVQFEKQNLKKFCMRRIHFLFTFSDLSCVWLMKLCK